MPHEISLCFGDINKLAVVKRLRALCHYLVKWVMNHIDILALFRRKVRAYFLAKKTAASNRKDRVRFASKMTMVLYKPGDTRMLTVFRNPMLSRVFYLMDPPIAMLNHPEYTAIAQTCI